MSSLSADPPPHHRDHHQMLMMIRKPIMIERKPLMLKDYLLDDLSSCSSNGFKSFPRRQCCTTVRFLLEIDLKHRSSPSSSSSSNHHKKKSHHDQRLRRSRSTSSTMSALQRASDAVINAVKSLPFPSVKSSIRSRNSKKGSSLLPRSLSKRLLWTRFWGKSDDEKIGRTKLTLPDHVLEERCEQSDENTTPTTTTVPTVVITTASGRVSTSTSSNSKSNSWCESEFTSEMLSSTENDVVESGKEVSHKFNKKVDIIVGDDSTEASITAKEWPNEEEKEQFSPVSILDCPFEDDDHDEARLIFHHKLALLEGNKQKLLQKIRRFENLTQLEPVDLEKGIAISELDDKLVTTFIYKEDDYKKRNKCEEKAREMMKHIKIHGTTASTSLKINNLISEVDNLLFDFFKERIMAEIKVNEVFNQKESLEVAENWLNGETKEVILGWEVKEAREAYLKEMEKNEKWKKVDEEKEEIGLELEFQLWDSLMQELLLDLS